MKTLIALVLIGCFVDAHAGQQMLVAESPEITVRLFAGPCESKPVLAKLAEIKAPAHLTFQAANETYHGHEIQGCWTAIDAETVVFIDEEGDGGAIPLGLFRVVEVI